MKNFLLNSKNIDRDSFTWNMAGSLLNAFQSVIMLAVLTRVMDLTAAGILTIAYANANLFLNIGKFGMRNYHVSDVRNEYSFREYHGSRIVTVVLMVVVSATYILYSAYSNGYSSEKAWIIFWMCLFKIPDAYEDVFFGEYQRRGRLDVAAKVMTIRMVITILVFALCVVVTKNLLKSLVISTIFTFLLMGYLLVVTYGVAKTEISEKKTFELKRLLWVCFPVFASAFLAFYIGNAPKYAIDAQLSDELQAIYGFIAMPVFVVGLLNSFIFNPILFQISCMWDERRVSDFVKSIVKQTMIVLGITLVCIAGAYVLGIPVLSVLYNTDLTNYKLELILLLVGGGLLGASGVYTTILTIMRRQKSLMWGYAAISLAAFFASSPVVAKWGMMGAVLLYDALMLALCGVFVVMIVVYIKEQSTVTDQAK